MSGRRRRSERDQRRRSLGQNFLVDQKLVTRLIAAIGIKPGDLVVDLGAGRGALTFPLAEAGARVWAVEQDPTWAAKLNDRVRSGPGGHNIRVIKSDLRKLRLPKEPFRVVANPPFNLTTEVLTRLLDDLNTKLVRADLILQREVVDKHTRQPPKTLKTAGWAPWWTFTAGPVVPASSFRPRPAVDASVLSVVRRDQPVLPTWLAPHFEELLRTAWHPPHLARQSGDRRRAGR